MRNAVVATIALLGILLGGCAPKLQDSIVAEIGNDKVTLGDYEALYVKSNGSREHGQSASLEEREQFLDLMIRYRLKLADAYAQGLDRRADVREEINQYKGSLARSYLTEHKLIRPAIETFTRRRAEEIRASHILLELKPDASPADSAEAYRQAYDIIREAQAGRDFTALVKAFSKDPTAERNNGDLYFFTTGQMVPEFEDAAYGLQVGQITAAPVRTRYGLHIIKVTDRQPAPGDVRCSHIMIRFASPTPTPEDTAAAYARIRAIQDSLKAGEDFAALARRNSEDRGSAPAGGDLNWFTRRRWVQPFDEVAMSLAVGQVSDIVRTPFGYHLILCTDRRPPKSAEEMEEDIKRQYQQTRFPADFARLLQGIKAELAYSVDDSVLALFYGALDSTGTTADSGWVERIPPEVGSMTLLRIDGRPFSVDSVAGLLRDRQDLGVLHLRASTLQPGLDRVTESLLFSAKADRLEREDPAFAALLREYKEGILLYQVEQENVWSRVQSSDSSLRAFFETRRDDYTYPDRVRFSELRLASSQVASAVSAELASGLTLEELAYRDSLRMGQPTELSLVLPSGSSKIPQVSADALRAFTRELSTDSLTRIRVQALADTASHGARNERLASRRLRSLLLFATRSLAIAPSRIDTLLRRGSWGSPHRQDTLSVTLVGRQRRVSGSVTTATLAPEADPRAKQADALALGATSQPFVHNAATVVVRLDAREPARQKTFEEAAPEVATAYQDYDSKRLEQGWLKELQTRFPVIKHPEVLHQAFSAPQ
jgi:peptidyl-prolyl cis-trans isomerase SurA